MIEGLPPSANAVVGVVGIGLILAGFIFLLQRGILWTGKQVQLMKENWAAIQAVQELRIKEKDDRLADRDKRIETLERVIRERDGVDKIRDETLREFATHLGELARQTETAERVVAAIPRAAGLDGG